MQVPIQGADLPRLWIIDNGKLIVTGEGSLKIEYSITAEVDGTRTGTNDSRGYLYVNGAPSISSIGIHHYDCGTGESADFGSIILDVENGDEIELMIERVCGSDTMQVTQVQFTVYPQEGFTPLPIPELEENEAAYIWGGSETGWILLESNNEEGFNSVPPAPLPFGTPAGAVEVTESVGGGIIATEWRFATNVASNGGWSNESNAESLDGNLAEKTLSGSWVIVGDMFGFSSLPSGSTIVGVEIAIWASVEAGQGTSFGWGAPTFPDFASAVELAPSATVIRQVFGGPSDTWGTTWAINPPSIRAALAASGPSGTPPYIEIDAFAVRFFYTPP